MTVLKSVFLVLLLTGLLACSGSETTVVTVTANSQTFAITKNSELTINLEGEDGAAHTFVITALPVNGFLTGQISGINPTVVYTPNSGFSGTDSIDFEVTDNAGSTATGTITIVILDTVNPSLDSDGDGLSDLDELNIYGTSPVLADTDADGFNDFKEVITFGFDASVNNLRFNPLIADIPQIDVQLTSAPDIFLNYTTSSGSSSTISTNRSQSSSQSVSSSKTLGQSTSFEHSHTFGVEVSAEHEFGLFGGTKAGVKISYSGTIAYGQESSQSWTEEQSQENSTALDEGEAFEESNSIDTSGGGIGITVQVSNGGNISYTLSNLFLSATYLDLSRPDPIIPIGNLSFENALGFPSFTLAPNESSGQLNFSTAELSIDTTKALLANSHGLIISPAIFDMLDENGTSFTFNNTAIQAQDALVIIDFADSDNIDILRLMVATNANPDVPGISISDVLQNVLQLSVSIDANDGFLTEVEGINNNEPTSRWIILHGAQSGNDTIVTTIYTTPSDETRVQSINSNVSNIVSSYDLSQIMVRGGDILHLVYLVDQDQDGISDRDELVYGTRFDNADTDGDGLNDSTEVYGWVVDYIAKSGATVSETVTSNPLVVDTDGDSLSDFLEANLATSDPTLKRNPGSRDTDGDGLADNLDDLDSGGAFGANVYDQLDINALAASLVTPSSFPSDVNVSYDVLDVTELGAGVPGNGINSYEVHVYRHISSSGEHPEPDLPPIDFAPVVLGQTLACGTGCDWELIQISPSIPGAVTQNFTDSTQIASGEDFKYIAYTRINALYNRSSQFVFASAAVETVTFHILPSTIENIRTVADPFTQVSDPARRIEYSKIHNEIFVSEGVKRILTINGFFQNALYGSVYNVTTGAKKSVSTIDNNISVLDPTRWYYDRCPQVTFSFLFNEIDANCWIEQFNTFERADGYVTDEVDANDVGNVITHPLGAGDGAFTLDWLLVFNNTVITPARGLATNDLRFICDTYRDRNNDSGDFSADQKFDAITSVPTNYVRRPSDINLSCDNIDAFADSAAFSIDAGTGGATFSRDLPAQPGCYRVRFIAFEYDEDSNRNGGNYNKVAYPYSGEADTANVDDAELCRDDLGIWTLEHIRLDAGHPDEGIVLVPATTSGNPNHIVYKTRSLIWDDSIKRTTMEGRMNVIYEIEID